MLYLSLFFNPPIHCSHQFKHPGNDHITGVDAQNSQNLRYKNYVNPYPAPDTSAMLIILMLIHPSLLPTSYLTIFLSTRHSIGTTLNTQNICHVNLSVLVHCSHVNITKSITVMNDPGVDGDVHSTQVNSS